jgi:hypothetical protein
MAGPDRISSGSAAPMVVLSVIGFVPGFKRGLYQPIRWLDAHMGDRPQNVIAQHAVESTSRYTQSMPK